MRRLAFFSGPNAGTQASSWLGGLLNNAGSPGYYLQLARDASLFDSTVTGAGGVTSISRTQRELKVYQHDIAPWEDSRIYLEDRDALAWSITTGFAEKMWMSFPVVSHPEHKRFFQMLNDMRFLETARDVEAMARRDGINYIYLRISGTPSESVERGDRPVSFSPVTRWQIPDTMIERHRGDDPLLLKHGIERVSIEQSDSEQKGQRKTRQMEVHGHRIIPFVRNRGRGYLWPTYDDLWYVKDVLYSLRMAQYGGNPIAVEVDLKFLQEVGEDLSEPEMAALKTQLNENIGKVQSGHQQHIAPVKGLIIKRVGAPDLDDPLPSMRAHASRISLVTGLSVNRILAASRGSEQVTDEDRLDEMTAVYERQSMDALPVYNYLLELFKKMGVVAARTPPLPLPGDIKWPFMRVLTPNQDAYVQNTNAAALKRAREVGRELDEQHMLMFPEAPAPIDPRLIPPKRNPEGPFDPETITAAQEMQPEKDEPEGGDEKVNTFEEEQRLFKLESQGKKETT